MSYGVVFVLVVIVVAVAFLVTDRLPIDQVALGVPIALLVGGVISASEAIAGLSHPATVTVAAMLVLGLGLERTGVISAIARWAREARLGGPVARLLAMCLLVAVVSPFLNNTAVVVVFLPVFLALASQADQAASRYLIPLSFSAILGGTVTVIGTSTNLIVWGIAEEHGYTELTIFSVAPLGLIYLAVGLAYLFTVGRRLLPDRPRPPNLSTKYDVRRFITELSVGEPSPAIGKTLAELDWGSRFDLSILDIRRRNESIAAPGGELRIEAGDVLVIQGDVDRLFTLADRMRLATPSELFGERPEVREDDPRDERLVEVIVTPASPLAGRTLKDVNFHQRYGAVVMAIQHHGRTLRARLADRRIEVGDLLLVHGSAHHLGELADAPGFVPLSEVGAPPAARPRAYVAAGIMGGIVLAAGLGIASILAASLVGVAAMVFTGCVKLREVYRDLDWSVLVLLAGLIPLGLAMETTGTAYLAGHAVAELLEGAGPIATVAVFYLVTSLFTEVMSNNAAAIVLAPIALLSAADLGMNPYALLVAVMFGASASFLTPLGYQTNTLIYDPGGYRFSDFLRVGAPLNLLLLVTASVAIPILWPS